MRLKTQNPELIDDLLVLEVLEEHWPASTEYGLIVNNEDFPEIDLDDVYVYGLLEVTTSGEFTGKSYSMISRATNEAGEIYLVACRGRRVLTDRYPRYRI